jgi:protein-tyrosine-phosphatase
MPCSRLASLTLSLTLLVPPLSAQPGAKDGNAVVTAMAFAHLYGSPDALTPAKDRELKTKLIAGLGQTTELTWDTASAFLDKDAFRKLSGGKDAISVEVMGQLVSDKTPQSRKDMIAKTRQHADLLSTQFDLIEEQHHKPAEQLAAWVVKHYQAGKPLGVIVVCTGNTRRSVLGATMGNVAAAYHGLPELRFYSGGTEPDAINPRTIATLKEVGLDIEPTGKEATRGKKGDENPIYRVRWGKAMETTEFSKKYTDAANPQEKFAALLVCSEAETACPNVVGATARIPVPYLDPKAFDGAAFEAAKYAERRDDIGRFTLSVMMQARRRLELETKRK